MPVREGVYVYLSCVIPGCHSTLRLDGVQHATEGKVIAGRDHGWRFGLFGEVCGKQHGVFPNLGAVAS